MLIPTPGGVTHHTGLLNDVDYACDFGSKKDVYDSGVVPDFLLTPTVSPQILSFSLFTLILNYIQRVRCLSCPSLFF